MSTSRTELVSDLAPPVAPAPQSQSQLSDSYPPTTAAASTSTPQSIPTASANMTSQSHPLSASASTSVPVSEGKGENAEAVAPGPMVHVRALVISGQSHVFSFEPETTVGRTKELIWSMWPSDWSSPAQPPSPSYLRILHAGRILQDDSTLTSNNLVSNIAATSPTVIHISVRSFSIAPEDDAKKGSNLRPSRTRSRGAGGNNNDEVGGCKCVIM